MARFEVGKHYRSNESGYDLVKCVRRTDKSVWMKYYYGSVYRMKIRTDGDGNEWTVDAQMPKRYWDALAIQAKYPED